MRWRTRFGAAVLLAVGGCASPATSDTATQQPAMPASFASERYGYEIQLLPDWFVRDEVPGQWMPSELNVGSAGSDWFQLDYPTRETGDNVMDEELPGVTYELYIAAAEAPAGTTLESWTATLADTMDLKSSCHGMPDQESTNVGGEPATVLVYDRTDCEHDHHVFLVSLLRGQRGYSLMWLAKRGEQDPRRADYEEMIRTFRFTN